MCTGKLLEFHLSPAANHFVTNASFQLEGRRVLYDSVLNSTGC